MLAEAEADADALSAVDAALLADAAALSVEALLAEDALLALPPQAPSVSATARAHAAVDTFMTYGFIDILVSRHGVLDGM